MAKLDMRLVSMGIPEEWLVRDETVVDLSEPCGEPPEVREWRMIVAFLNNC